MIAIFPMCGEPVVGGLGSLAIIQFLLLTKTLTVSLSGLAVS